MLCDKILSSVPCMHSYFIEKAAVFATLLFNQWPAGFWLAGRAAILF